MTRAHGEELYRFKQEAQPAAEYHGVNQGNLQCGTVGSNLMQRL